MDSVLFGIPKFDVYAVMGILIFFSLIETLTGILHHSKRTASDWIQEFGSFLMLSVVQKPLIVLAVFGVGKILMPDSQYLMQGWSLWINLPIYLLIDDVLQYLYHRKAHEQEWLWKLHRSHHQAEEMGFFVSYRNAMLYYALMPNIWWVGIMTFLGCGKAIAIGLILKQLVIIGSHSPTKWDQYLYKYKFLNPFTWLIERIIITPAFHFAHHGKSMKDGISDPNGNFGNMFSIWDQLFGTAKFTRQYPTELGLINDPKDPWAASYLYPFITSNKPDSEISKGFIKTNMRVLEPKTVYLEVGEKYLWCQCGKSKNQPFCDGSHHGSTFKPLLFEVKKTGNVRLCQCKMTKTGPFCDNSHIVVAEIKD
jgi:sterol desaturase/sphingolipid hydroxylase (fatty acid hydroxylase superfamily)/CDGSH-type Zn-finger protein